DRSLKSAEPLRLLQLRGTLQLPRGLTLAVPVLDDDSSRAQLARDRKQSPQSLVPQRNQEHARTSILPGVSTDVGQELNDALDSDREADAGIGRTAEQLDQPVVPPPTRHRVLGAELRRGE